MQCQLHVLPPPELPALSSLHLEQVILAAPGPSRNPEFYPGLILFDIRQSVDGGPLCASLLSVPILPAFLFKYNSCAQGILGAHLQSLGFGNIPH